MNVKRLRPIFLCPRGNGAESLQAGAEILASRPAGTASPLFSPLPRRRPGCSSRGSHGGTGWAMCGPSAEVAARLPSLPASGDLAGCLPCCPSRRGPCTVHASDLGCTCDVLGPAEHAGSGVAGCRAEPRPPGVARYPGNPGTRPGQPTGRGQTCARHPPRPPTAHPPQEQSHLGDVS